MWHEARKQERRIRGLIVDYRRRAERRQDFYEKIQADPTQFIQIHGRRCKIHLDPAVAAAGDGAAIIVPWQGQQDNLIDRFDVRAHLDYIPVIPKTTAPPDGDNDLTQEERQCNYERFRILAQNDFLNISEEKFLYQLYLEEQYGVNATADNVHGHGHGHGQTMGKKKAPQKFGAAIGYSYDEPGENTNEGPFSHLHQSGVVTSGAANAAASAGVSSATGNTIKRHQKDENDSDTESESDVDMDVSIDVTKLDTSQAHELNACGRNYGMLSNDFYSYLTKDADDADALRIAREEQREKMLLSGRKSRRERKAQKERRIANRPLSPPSYAAKDEDETPKAEETDSRSPSPIGTATGKITYITSFGGEDELQQPHSKISINLPKKMVTSSMAGSSCAGGASEKEASKDLSYAEKLKENLEKLGTFNESSLNKTRRRRTISSSSSRSSSSRSFRRRRRGRSRSYGRRSRSRTYGRSHRSSRRSRSGSYIYHKRYRRDDRRKTRSKSHSSRRTKSKSRERQHHRHRYGSGSVSTHKHRSTYRKSRSRSNSPKRHYSSRSSSSSSATYSRSKSKRTPSSKCSKLSPINKRKSSHSSLSPVRQHCSIEKSQLHQQQKSVTEIATTVTQMPDASTTSSISLSFASSTKSIVGATIADASAVAADIDIIEPPPPPLKRYYGRKRDQCTSSSSSSNSGDETESNVNKCNIAGSVILGTGKTHRDTQQNRDIDTTSEKSNPLPSTSYMSVFNAVADNKQAGKYSTINIASTHCNPTPEIKGSSASTVTSCGGRLNLRERLKRKMQSLLNKQYKADKKAEIEKTEREKQLQQEREEEMRELALKLRRRQRELRHRYGSPNSVDSESTASDVGVLLAGLPIGGASGASSGNRNKEARSKSHSTERSDRRIPYDREKRSPARARSRSSSRDRRHRSSSRSSRSYSRHNKNQHKSRSRSRSRRSHSKRRRRSMSRSTRHQRNDSRDRPSRHKGNDRPRDGPYDRERERERQRSRSRSDKRYQDRYRNREQQQQQQQCTDRQYYERRYQPDDEHVSERDYRYQQQSYQHSGATSTATTSVASTSRSSSSRVVISAPPKLKKLVDY